MAGIMLNALNELSKQQLYGGGTIFSSIVLARALGHSEIDQIACGHIELEF